MQRKASIILAAAFALALIAVPARAADDEEVRQLRSRLDRVERVLEQVQRASGRPAAREGAEGAVMVPADREQLGRIVREEIEKNQDPNELTAIWDEGLELVSGDGAFELEIGGRVMVDAAFMDADSEISDTLGELEGDAEFRRLRFFMAGDIYDNVGYKLQVDFAGGDADIKDAYLAFANLLPFAGVKAGHFKEPFSLEELTSSKYITFMERALPVAAFSPSRNIGIQASNAVLDKRATWAVGTFVSHDSDDDDATFEEGWNVTGRATALPWYEDDGRKLLHVGAAGSARYSPDMVRFRSRPEVHLADERWVNTADAFDPATSDELGKFETDSVLLCGLEAALVHGPFSLQGEYIFASTDTDSEVVDDPSFDGFYIFASYFLTGEHRPYKTSSGSFSRVKPKKNFDGEGNWGAWEVAARYSHLDLNDDEIEYAGELGNVTLGLNWYLNPNMRVMWNYVCSTLDDRMRLDEPEIDDADASTFMMRFQVDF